MATSNERITIYPGADTVEDLDFLVAQDARRTGRRSTRSRVIVGLIEKKKRDYDAEENNEARIRHLKTGLEEVKEELRALRLESNIEKLESRLAALEDKFDRLFTYLMEERNHVRPIDNQPVQ